MVRRLTAGSADTPLALCESVWSEGGTLGYWSDALELGVAARDGPHGSRGQRGSLWEPRGSLGRTIATWLILPVVICLSQRLSHACLSTSLNMVKPRMAH